MESFKVEEHLRALVAREAALEQDVHDLDARLQAGVDEASQPNRPRTLVVGTTEEHKIAAPVSSPSMSGTPAAAKVQASGAQANMNTPGGSVDQELAFYTPRSSISAKRAPRISSADSGVYIAYSPSAKRSSPPMQSRRGDRGDGRSLSISSTSSKRRSADYQTASIPSNSHLRNQALPYATTSVSAGMRSADGNGKHLKHGSTLSSLAPMHAAGVPGIKDSSSPAVSPVSRNDSNTSLASDDSLGDVKCSSNTALPRARQVSMTQKEASFNESHGVQLLTHQAAVKSAPMAAAASVDSPAREYEIPAWHEDKQSNASASTEHASDISRINQLDHIASTIRTHITSTGETLQDHLRVCFEEAVDGMVTMLKQTGPNATALTSSQLRLWAAEAARPSEAAVRERFQSLQKRAMECLSLVKPPELTERSTSSDCGCARYLCYLLPELVEGIEDPGIGDFCKAMRTKLEAAEAMTTNCLDKSRLDQLDRHVEQLESALNIAVVELEVGAADAKNLEASCISAQAKAASAEQRATIAEKERDTLAQQLSFLKQQSILHFEQENPANNNDGRSHAELRARLAEADAAEAKSEAILLRKELHVLRLEAQMAHEQLRAFGIRGWSLGE